MYMEMVERTQDKILMVRWWSFPILHHTAPETLVGWWCARSIVRWVLSWVVAVGRAGVESSEVLFSCEILMCRRPRGQWAAGRHQSRADLASWPPIGGQAGAMGSDHRPLGPRSANQGRGSGGCGPMAGRDQCPRPISRAAGRVNTADQGTMSLGPPLGCFSRRRSCARIWLAIAEEVLLRKEQSTMVTFIF